MDLQELSDRAELLHLVTVYAYAIDEREFHKLDQVFTPDAHIDYTAMGGIQGDYPTVKAWLPQALQHFPGYQHFIGNTLFEIDGDEATGKVACFNPMVVPSADGGAETMFLGLWYIDRYRRTPQGWRIVERSERKSYEHNMPEWMKKALASQKR